MECADTDGVQFEMCASVLSGVANSCDSGNDYRCMLGRGALTLALKYTKKVPSSIILLASNEWRQTMIKLYQHVQVYVGYDEES